MTPTEKEKTWEIYKGYLIKRVFKYTSGKADYQVYPDEGNECGFLCAYTTVEKVKEEIDNRIV